MGHLQAVLTTSALQCQCSASCPANPDQMSPTFGFFLTHPFLSSKSHRDSHLTALSTTLLHRYHSAFFLSEWSLYSLWKGEQKFSAAARGEGGRLPHNLFRIQTCSLWWSKFTNSWQQFQRWTFAPHSSAKEGCWQGPCLCGGEEWESPGSAIPRTSSREDIVTRWKLPSHRLDNTSIRANLASTPWDTGLDLTR